LQALVPYLNIAQILVSIFLVTLILLQTRGAGLAIGYSPDTSIFRTRRGVERTLFQLTIATAILYTFLSILSVVVPRFEI
jgi:preprotein translocase subunit SecG